MFIRDYAYMCFAKRIMAIPEEAHVVGFFTNNRAIRDMRESQSFVEKMGRASVWIDCDPVRDCGASVKSCLDNSTASSVAVFNMSFVSFRFS